MPGHLVSQYSIAAVLSADFPVTWPAAVLTLEPARLGPQRWPAAVCPAGPRGWQGTGLSCGPRGWQGTWLSCGPRSWPWTGLSCEPRGRPGLTAGGPVKPSLGTGLLTDRVNTQKPNQPAVDACLHSERAGTSAGLTHGSGGCVIRRAGMKILLKCHLGSQQGPSLSAYEYLLFALLMKQIMPLHSRNNT